ncbi:MAG: HNH endonuclease [Panacagrimonas sp.]
MCEKLINDKYSSIRKPFEDSINIAIKKQEEFWENSFEYRVLICIKNRPQIPDGVALFGILGLLFLMQSKNSSDQSIFCIALISSVAYLLSPSISRRLMAPARRNVLSRNQLKLKPFLSDLEKARAILAALEIKQRAELRSEYDYYPGYPPDWAERRAEVLRRDDHKCTKCGYPNGFSRRVRELHVHHQTALSAGGTNHISNLLTLCHVCHRRVDHKHRGVKRMHPRARR